jgi:hypothetical protein
LQRQHKKYIKLLKEEELLNRTTFIPSKIEKEEIFSFLEENVIFGDEEWNF